MDLFFFFFISVFVLKWTCARECVRADGVPLSGSRWRNGTCAEEGNQRTFYSVAEGDGNRAEGDTTASGGASWCL